jgi:hypothetical protein
VLAFSEFGRTVKENASTLGQPPTLDRSVRGIWPVGERDRTCYPRRITGDRSDGAPAGA